MVIRVVMVMATVMVIGAMAMVMVVVLRRVCKDLIGGDVLIENIPHVGPTAALALDANLRGTRHTSTRWPGVNEPLCRI